MRLWIRNTDSSLSCPENTSRDSTERSSEKDKPLNSIAVIRVQACAIHRETKCAEDQSALDADILDQTTCEPARYNHEAESEGIRSVNEVGLLGSASTEGVHGAP